MEISLCTPWICIFYFLKAKLKFKKISGLEVWVIANTTPPPSPHPSAEHWRSFYFLFVDV
jgi:hypothetical protein